MKYWHIQQNQYIEWKKQEKVIHIKIWRTDKTNLWWRKSECVIWGGRSWKRLEGTSWVTEMYLDLNGGHMGIYTCNNSWSYILKVCMFYLSLGKKKKNTKRKKRSNPFMLDFLFLCLVVCILGGFGPLGLPIQC